MNDTPPASRFPPPAWRRYLRFFRPSVEGDIDDEMRFHLESRVEDLVARGLSPAAARAQALAEYGDVNVVRTQLRAIGHRVERRYKRTEWRDGLAQDLRYATRVLRAQPGFAAVVALTLALGIGANAAMFGVVDRLLLRPPAGVRDPGRVARLYFTRTFSWAGVVTMDASSYADYELLRAEARSFERVATYLPLQVTLGRGADATQVRWAPATASFFPLLGVRPALGRFYVDDEDRRPLGAAVAVVSHGFWRRAFGADAGVIGRTVLLGRRRYTIIGVAEPGFSGLDLEAVDVWVPFSAAAAELAGDRWYQRGSWTGPKIIVRVRPGTPAARANAEATALFRHGLAEETPGAAGVLTASGAIGSAPAADPAAHVAVGSVVAGRGPLKTRQVRSAKVSAWLAGMAAVVLLIACANIANLLLSRAARRRHEIAVRVALGAGRARLVRQLLAESLVLSLLGGAAGLLAAAWGGGAIRGLLLPDVAWAAPPVDARVLGVTLALVLLTTLLTGLVPALQASRPDVVSALKAGAREGTVRRSATRGALLVAQAGLSALLLVGAGLFVRSLWGVLTTDLGYDASRVLVAYLDPSGSELERAELERYYRAAQERLRRMPGVASAALATSIPFYSSTSIDVHVPGRDSLPVTRDGGPYVVEVSPEYFAAMGVRVVRGRGFTAGDVAGGPRVTAVSEAMARIIWPGESALGKCLRVGADTAPCSEVVGVVEDARRQSLEALPVMQYYVPLDQRQVVMSAPVLFVRTVGDPEALVSPVRRELQRLLADLPFVEVRPLQALINPQIQPWRLGATMFTLFGALALLIAAVGLYGVLAYEVAQRRHEFGVRMALGAKARDVIRLVLGRGMRPVLAGVVLGVALAAATGRFIAPLLWETAPTDPIVYAAVVLTLLGVAALAGLLPAWRASRVDPASALRVE